MSKLGKAVRALRLAAGMTVDDLAPKIGCSYKHLFNIEQGESKPSIEIYVTLVRVLKAGKLPLVD